MNKAIKWNLLLKIQGTRKVERELEKTHDIDSKPLPTHVQVYVHLHTYSNTHRGNPRATVTQMQMWDQHQSLLLFNGWNKRKEDVKPIANVNRTHLLGVDSAGFLLVCAQGHHPALRCFCPECEALGHTELLCNDGRGPFFFTNTNHKSVCNRVYIEHSAKGQLCRPEDCIYVYDR